MPRIFLTTWGSFGDLFPLLGVATGLKARGHDVRLATLPAYREIVEAEGVTFHPMRPDVAKDDFAMIARVMDPKKGPESIFRGILLPAIRQQYEDILAAADGIDLLVTHPAAPAGPIVAQKLGLRWAATVLAPVSFFSAYDPPVLPQLPPLAHLMRRSPAVARLFFGFARRLVRRWCAPIQDLRRDLGLPTGRNPIFEEQFSPHLNLALFSPLLAQPQPDWPPHAEIAGFIPYNGPEAGLSDDLNEFLDAGDPPVVFTLGSSAAQVAGPFYRESAAAAARLGVRAVLLVGRNPANRLTNLPPGVIAVESAPHADLFPRASVIVHQAGAGTLGQALRAGKPMLIVPHAHDQPDNADRARRLGVARVLYPQRYDAKRAAEHLNALLTTSAYRERAEAVGRQARAENGIANACDALERLLLAQP